MELARAGDVDHGLLWMAQALVQTPAEQPDFARLVRANLSGWENQVFRRRAVLDHQRHAVARESARFRPDGRAIVTLCDDRAARLWDMATGRQLCAPLHHPSLVRCCAFSPDGRYLATGCQDGSIRLWDAVTGKPSGPALGSGGDTDPRTAVVEVTFSPDGRLLLSREAQKGTALWDVKTGHRLELPKQARAAFPAGFLPDGSRVMLVNVASRMTGIWEASTGSLRAPTIRGDRLGFSDVFASGRRIASSEAGLGGFFAGGRVIGISSDGKTARLWDANTGRAVVTLPPAAVGSGLGDTLTRRAEPLHLLSRYHRFDLGRSQELFRLRRAARYRLWSRRARSHPTADYW